MGLMGAMVYLLQGTLMLWLAAATSLYLSTYLNLAAWPVKVPTNSIPSGQQCPRYLAGTAYCTPPHAPAVRMYLGSSMMKELWLKRGSAFRWISLIHTLPSLIPFNRSPTPPMLGSTIRRPSFSRPSTSPK